MVCVCVCACICKYTQITNTDTGPQYCVSVCVFQSGLSFLEQLQSPNTRQHVIAPSDVLRGICSQTGLPDGGVSRRRQASKQYIMCDLLYTVRGIGIG